MPALVSDEPDPLFDPDELKMPESPAHRRTIDMIALAAARMLGPEHRVFRDMNWYPTDGGTAIAPDLFVLPADAMPLPAGAVADWPKSYRQDQSDGPAPSVVVEIPSDSDGFASLRSKAGRCRRLGATVYLVVITGSPPEVLRLAADDQADEVWTDRAIPELGGLRIGFEEGMPVVTTPDGLRVTSDEDLTDQLANRATEAESRAERLAQRLREAGIDPDAGPS